MLRCYLSSGFQRRLRKCSHRLFGSRSLKANRQQLHDYPNSCDCHTYTRAVTSRVGEQPLDHIIKSPPLMSRDVPVM